MISASIEVNSHNVAQSVAEKLAKLEPQRLAKLASEPLRIFWRDRMKSLGENKRGWPSTGFWESAARSVQSIVQPGGLILRCDKVGVRQRWLGGPIKPVKADALAIPISPVSYGHRPSEFPGLFLMKTAKGAYLVQAQAVDSTKKTFPRERRQLGGNYKLRLRAALNFLFKLSAGVDQSGDPRVVPTEDEFREVIMGTIEKEVSLTA